jgi:hypothetical protein
MAVFINGWTSFLALFACKLLWSSNAGFLGQRGEYEDMRYNQCSRWKRKGNGMVLEKRRKERKTSFDTLQIYNIT